MIDKSILLVAETALRRLQEPEWVAVDCRFDLADPHAGRALYEQEHIPSAVYLDLDRHLAGRVTPGTGRHPLPDVDTIVGQLETLGIGNANKVLVYDDSSGGLAARAWWILHWLGHDDVYLLDGGLDRWRSLGYPTDARQVVRSRAAFEARPRNELVVTTDEIAAAVKESRRLRLLDARAAARFRGDEEPIDPVAGHIPGASSMPFDAFVTSNGTWRPLAERRAQLLSALDNDLESPWNVMCGSGVTACHLAISAIEAGLSEPRLYVGSWSEWIRDATRPVATGEG